MPHALVVIAALLVAACSGSGGTTTPTIALTVPLAPPPTGTTVFGTSEDVSAMTVAKPAITFSTADLVGWVAVLSDSITRAGCPS